MTDKKIYIYNKKTKDLQIKKNIEKLIKDNCIYDVKKTIKYLNNVVNREVINNKLFKIRIYFMISKNISPSELYCFKEVFKNVVNIKYEILFEEDFLNNSEEIIIWNEIIYLKYESFSVFSKKIKKTLCDKKYILIGDSDNFAKFKKRLENITNTKIMEYENRKTILFERV
ncbi:MAG: hypothetical protein PHF21_00700 [Bacilli bacterium]|nr:hypothetical protein [Bacilli bacterium]